MDTALWIVTAILAFAFGAAGLMKLTQPVPALVEKGQGWAEDFSPAAVKAIGAVEVTGALGLVLPELLDIAPILTPLAAVGLALTMVGAAVVHARRGEYPNIGANVVLAALALFVAVGRF